MGSPKTQFNPLVAASHVAYTQRADTHTYVFHHFLLITRPFLFPFGGPVKGVGGW